MDQYFDSRVVVFLEHSDFDNNMKFVHDLERKKLVIMLGGSFCGHCTHTAPIFNEFAKQVRDNGLDVVPAVVQVDGGDTEKALGQRLGQLADVQGIPSFLLFDSNGNYVKKHTGARSLKGLLDFSGK